MDAGRDPRLCERAAVLHLPQRTSDESCRRLPSVAFRQAVSYVAESRGGRHVGRPARRRLLDLAAATRDRLCPGVSVREMSQAMKAVVITRFGGPEVLELREVEA